MATAVNSEITNMQNQTAYFNHANSSTKTNSTDDSNMFLTLMLQQLQNQDPTQPTDNTEWLAQLAQYSSLEQMAQMNTNLSNCMGYLSNFYNDSAANSEITQTLALVGKEVSIKIPAADSESGKDEYVSGSVSEASFEEGTGKVKVGDNYYSIANIVTVKDKTVSNNAQTASL